MGVAFTAVAELMIAAAVVEVDAAAANCIEFIAGIIDATVATAVVVVTMEVALTVGILAEGLGWNSGVSGKTLIALPPPALTVAALMWVCACAFDPFGVIATVGWMRTIECGEFDIVGLGVGGLASGESLIVLACEVLDVRIAVFPSLTIMAAVFESACDESADAMTGIVAPVGEGIAKVNARSCMPVGEVVIRIVVSHINVKNSVHIDTHTRNE